MRFHADLHVHSKYSRATSRDLDLEHLAAWACRKGIGVVGTGDFTHPGWCAELKRKLVPAEPGLYRLRGDIEQAIAQTLPPPCRASVRFMLEVEISTIYKKADPGLSSDPPMNWRVSFLDRYRLTSNSDAHSPGKLGREATTFDCERDYFAIKHALETGRGYVGTVEFFPDEGKYHLDGHRKCE